MEEYDELGDEPLEEWHCSVCGTFMGGDICCSECGIHPPWRGYYDEELDEDLDEDPRPVEYDYEEYHEMGDID